MEESEGKEIIISNLKHKIIKKKVLENGKFDINLLEGSACRISISDVYIQMDDPGFHGDDESVFLSQDFDGAWVVGNAESYIDLDIERCLRHMFLHETSIVSIDYLNKHENTALSITCKIKILDADITDLFCNWHWAKKVTTAKRHKDAGKLLVKRDRLIEAFIQFSKALKFLLTLNKNDLEDVSEIDLKEVETLKVDLYNNLAFCQLQYKEYQPALELCNKALQINKKSKKALYRRGSAFMGLNDWEAAYADICQLLSLDPNNAAAKCKAAELREKVKHINEAYKKVIKNMFA